MSNNYSYFSYTKILVRLIVSVLLLLSYFTPVNAYYVEDFDGNLSHPLDWNVFHDSGIGFTSSEISLVKSSDKSFPYLSSTEKLMDENTASVEIRFKYSYAGGFGTGLALTDVIPSIDTVMLFPAKFYQYSIFYIWQNNLSPFLHIKSSVCSIDNATCNSAIMPTIFQSNTIDTNWHTLTVQRNTDNSYKLYFDGLLIFESIQSTRNLSGIWIGNPESTITTNSWSNLNLDYIKINSTQDTLPVPYLSQRDDKWKDSVYDSATVWAGSEEDSIERWGCALTSVAMILQKYNIKMPDGSVANPDTLNSWLIGESDGYVGSGLLNWLAITRLTRQSRAAEHATTDLEFVKSSGTPSEELTAGLFPIVNTGSHFVVTHGESAENYKINDPFEASQSALAKTRTLASINTFSPSNTDLSYLMIVGDDNLVATISSGQNIIEAELYDESITDDLGSKNNPITRSYYFAKPSSGTYRLQLTNHGERDVSPKIYVYDEVGSVNTHTLPLSANSSQEYQIIYDKTSSASLRLVALDNTAPAAPTLFTPADSEHRQPSGLILDWNDVDDPSLPITYWYKSSWSGGSYGPVSTGANSYINASGSADREYSWYVKACDSANNCSGWSSGTKLFVDSVRPSADLVFPNPGPSSTYFDVIFSESVNSEAATNPANYFLNNWPGAGGSGDLLGDATISYNDSTKTARVSFGHAGWYISPEQQWGVSNVVDLAGNTISPNPTTEYSTPVLPPSTPIVSTTLISPTNASSQNWTWSSSDSGSGIKGYYEQIYDVLKLLPGEWIWAGNLVGATTHLSDGIWQMKVRAEDNAGNMSEIGSSQELTVDTIAPDPPLLLSPADAVVTNGKYVLQDWSDSKGAAKYIYESYNDAELKSLRYRGIFTNSQKDASNIAESTYWWRVAAVDLAGNQGLWSEVRKIVIDNTVPQLVSKTSFSGWYREMQSSYFDYTDQYMESGYLAPSCEISAEGRAQSCQVVPNVCDQAGNCNTLVQTSNPCDIDLTAPKTLLNAWGSTINGTASDTLSGVERTEIKITKPDNSTTTVKAVGTNNWTYTMPESPLGNYKIVVASYDNAGNMGNEIVKDFVMSESARSTQVLGASTEKIDERSEEGEASGEIRDETSERREKVEEQEVRREVSEEGDNESVLGEKTENKSNNWWWLVMIPFCVGIFWISTKLFGE